MRIAVMGAGGVGGYFGGLLARSGEDVNRASPDAVDLRNLEEMRKDILRLGEEGYTRIYQEWIRKYMEALSRLDRLDRKTN